MTDPGFDYIVQAPQAPDKAGINKTRRGSGFFFSRSIFDGDVVIRVLKSADEESF